MLRPHRSVLPRVHPTAFIDASAQIIGDVEIGEESSVWMAAVIRGYRKPEPYKGKGIKYETETVRRKEGKKK